MPWHPCPQSYNYFGNVSEAAYQGKLNLIEWYGVKYPGLRAQWQYYVTIYEQWNGGLGL